MSIQFDEIPVLNTESLEKADLDQLSAAFLLFDKPKGRSSFWGVKLVRWASKIKKVGHAGTLDPMATGLLVLGLGKATKFIEQIQADEKEYIAELKFGEATASYDAESEVEQTSEWNHITKEALEKIIREQFLGEIQQTPPIFSALKIDGKRLYEYARKGEEVEIKSRIVRIKEIEITRFDLPFAELRVVCGKGTYIRSLANDIGLALNSLAHLTALRRTRIGTFNVESALDENQVKTLFGKHD
ncbi:tRNA pseudouridine(55) synthase TruB [bacterium]|nr:MAG: tRNA pseudouridine(55) synthase TruB [bacterium]